MSNNSSMYHVLSQSNFTSCNVFEHPKQTKLATRQKWNIIAKIFKKESRRNMKKPSPGYAGVSLSLDKTELNACGAGVR